MSATNDDHTELVKAPGKDGDILLTRGTVVEVEWPTGSRIPYYVDEGGYQIAAGKVGNGKPYPWSFGRIVRVLTEDKPAQEPVLPRRIEPEDVRVGMVVERRKGESYVGGRVKSVEKPYIKTSLDITAWAFALSAAWGWSLWLVEDAPEPVDPDAAAIEAMAQKIHDQTCDDEWSDDWSEHREGEREAWRNDARALLAVLRETHVVTPRAEQ